MSYLSDYFLYLMIEDAICVVIVNDISLMVEYLNWIMIKVGI